MSEYLTVRQVAERFGVSPGAVRRWIRRRILAAKRDRVTRILYVPEDAVRAREAQLVEWQPEGRPVGAHAPQGEALAQETDDMADSEDAPDVEPEETTAPPKKRAAKAPPKTPAKATRDPAPAKSWGSTVDEELGF